MAINYDALPTERPINKLEKGPYYAKIEKAEMRQGKDPSKPPYISLTYALANKDKKSCGKMFDLISEPTKDFTKYKLSRFIRALGVHLSGEGELKDLCKILVGKTIIVDVTQDSKDYNTVDVFAKEIYYPVSEAATIFADYTLVENIVDDEAPIAVADALDASDADLGNDDLPFDMGDVDY